MRRRSRCALRRCADGACRLSSTYDLAEVRARTRTRFRNSDGGCRPSQDQAGFTVAGLIAGQARLPPPLLSPAHRQGAPYNRVNPPAYWVVRLRFRLAFGLGGSALLRSEEVQRRDEAREPGDEDRWAEDRG